MNKKTISFVLPVYNEAKGIYEFYRVLAETLSKLGSKYEIELFFVNDGSTDGTGNILKQIADKDKRVTIIDFARNFGHQIAITAGLDYAKGDAVLIMDTDLQDPPHTILDLVEEWENGFEVVYAVRRSRKDKFFKKITAAIFYRLMAIMSDYPIPENAGDFRLLDAKAAAAMRQYREVHRFMRGIAAHIGFKQKAVLFDRDDRRAGETHYPFKKMLRFATDAVVSFSEVPLRFMSRVGFFISGASVVGIVYAIIVKTFFASTAVQGWTFLTVAIFFIGGMQLLMLGIIGEYVGRIYAESKGRPLYIVSSVHGISEK